MKPSSQAEEREWAEMNDRLYARRALAALLSDVLPGGHNAEPTGEAAKRRLAVLRQELERMLQPPEAA